MRLGLFASHKPKQKSFIALLVSDTHVCASLWEVNLGRIEVKRRSEVLEWQPEVEASLADSSAVSLEQLGSEANKVDEVLFGLPDSWAHEQAIATAKKPLLKELTQQLNLKSIGFVVTDEAIVAYLRSKHVGPLHAVVCFLSQKGITLHIVHSGIAEQSFHAFLTGNLAADFLDLCTRNHVSDIPITVYLASLDLPEEQLALNRSQLLAHEWDVKLFSKKPNIEVLTLQYVVDSVCMSGGLEVARSLGLIDTQVSKEVTEKKAEQEVSKENENPFGFTQLVSQESEEQEQVGAEEETMESENGEDEGKSEGKIDLKHTSHGSIFTHISGFLSKQIVGILAIVLVLCALFIIGTLAIVAKASVTLKVGIRSQPISTDTQLLIDPNAQSSDISQGIVKATTKQQEVSGNLDGDTTGSKVIGDHAKGTVTIANHTLQAKVFHAGTVFTSGNLKFTLDSDTTVASASSSFGSEVFGQANAPLTAVAIGADSNVAKDTVFTVSTFDPSAFQAKANEAFTGGSSRTAQVVSASDQKQLADSLYAQLKKQAQDQLSSQSSPSEHVIISDVAQVTNKQFSASVGDEAKSLSLSMTIQAQGIIFTNDDLQGIAQSKLATVLSPGSSLILGKTDISILNQQATDSGRIAVKVTLTSQMTPAFSVSQLKSQLAGQTFDRGRTILNSQPAISTYTLSFTPSFAGLILQSFPKDPTRIRVQTIQL